MPAQAKNTAAEGNQVAERLDTVIELLTEQNRLLVSAGETLAPHLGLLDRAATMMSSPAARIANLLPGQRAGGRR